MKSMLIKIFVITVLCALNNYLLGQQNDSRPKKIADEILLHSTAYKNLKTLCKDVGPRLSGSAGAALAIEKTIQMMRDAGADTAYLQPCMVTHWVRGTKEKAYALSAGRKITIAATALGNSVGTSAKGLKRNVIEVKSMDELKNIGFAAKDKIIFFNIPMNPLYIETFKAYGESGIARRSGPAEAAKLGAAGVIVRSLSSNTDHHPHTGTTVYQKNTDSIPAIAISTKDADWLSNELRKNKDLQFYFRTNCKLLPDALSYNVIGEIKGSDIPQEIITVGGHLDSWDLAEGAHDDGTGCMQSIEVLRALKATGTKPRRTIRAVLFMNEENGGGGGKAYLDSAVAKKEKHIFALESDAGGFTPRAFGVDGSEETIAKIKLWLPYLKPYYVTEIKTGGGGSDIAPLKKINTVLAGYIPDSQRYFDVHHAATDIFEAVSERELNLGSVNISILVYLVSEYGL